MKNINIQTFRPTMKRLDDDERSRIIASCALPSIHNAVEELVLNSIDAKSSQIEIGVDLIKMSIKVTDNGKYM